jgi:viroplasmin and RNaseH domain-containing protein
MSSKKYYAVLKGRKTGVFESWAEWGEIPADFGRK